MDEKISYLLSKPYTLKNDDKQYMEKVKGLLGKRFTYHLNRLGYEASNKGIGWLQVYIDEAGKFSMMVIPAEQCIPIWADSTHEELAEFIRIYSSSEWERGEKKTIQHVEHWLPDGVKHYIKQNNQFMIDVQRSFDESAPIGHYRKDGNWFTWGKVPFIPFKNNMVEMPDIQFIKSEIDGYDLSRSEAANYVEEVKNLIYVLKGYVGENLREFMEDLNTSRVISLDADENSGLDALTPTMDITALREHYEQLKRDILEDGQGVNKDLDKFGSAPSGVALRFMYTGLNLKCNAMEAEFQQGFALLDMFMDLYLLETGQGDYFNSDMVIEFNRNIPINETETINNCNASKDTVSDKTILSKHPWVKDIEKEKKWLEEQEQKNEPEWNKVPLKEAEDEQPRVLGKANS